VTTTRETIQQPAGFGSRGVKLVISDDHEGLNN
jgi:hypothetical protein